MSGYKYTPLIRMKGIVKLYHAPLVKYNVHPVEYCILNMLSKLTIKADYTTVSKGDIAKFIRINPSTFSYHFFNLKKNRIVEEKPGKGIRIVNPEYIIAFAAYTSFAPPFTLVSYDLIGQWNLRHIQYCVLHSLFITQYYLFRYFRLTSLSKIAGTLNLSLEGLRKIITGLENTGYLISYGGNQIVLSDEVIDGFYDLHTKYEVNNSSTLIEDTL